MNDSTFIPHFLDSLRLGILRAGLFTALWWLFTEGNTASWVIGIPTVILATLASLALTSSRRLRISLVGLARFVPFFLWHSFRGGVDVAQRVFHKQIPLHTAIIRYQTRLPKGVPRVFMIDTITLMPGTLGAEMEGEELLIHVLDTRMIGKDDFDLLEQHIAAVFHLKVELL